MMMILIIVIMTMKIMMIIGMIIIMFMITLTSSSYLGMRSPPQSLMRGNIVAAQYSIKLSVWLFNPNKMLL